MSIFDNSKPAEAPAAAASVSRKKPIRGRDAMIRRRKRDGAFWIFLLIHMLINFDGTIPGWILLALHFWLDISIFWSIGAFALWLLWILLWVLVIDWASDSSSKADIPRENKNPYSVGNQKSDRS